MSLQIFLIAGGLFFGSLLLRYQMAVERFYRRLGVRHGRVFAKIAGYIFLASAAIGAAGLIWQLFLSS